VISVANARLRNLPFVIVAASGMIDSESTAALIAVAPDGPIAAAKDLNGKIVCGSSPGSLDQVGVDSWIDKHGGDAQSIKYVELAQAERAVALQQGRVAACAMTNPVLAEAVAAHRVRTIGKIFDGIAPRFVATVMIARRDWATAHRDVTRRFAAALADADAWSAAHPEQAAVILEKYTKIKEDRVLARPAPSLDPRLIQPLLDAAARYKVIPRPLDAHDLLLNDG
jgi:NitT/TauT family transport system substrate-binding protein